MRSGSVSNVNAPVGVVPYRTRSNETDLSAIGRSLWAKRWLILVPAIIVGLLSAVAVSAIVPRYKAEARVIIDGRDNVFLRPEADRQTGERQLIDMEAMASQVQVLTSRDLARQIVRQLKLTELPEFNPTGGSISGLLNGLTGRDTSRLSPEDRAIELFFQKLSVVPVEKSRVITVEFTSVDPELAARVANAVVDRYLALQQETKNDQTRAASQWLAGEIATLRPRVVEAENKVEEFRAKANLFVGSNNANLTSQQLSELTTQLATARAQKADIDARLRIVRDLLRAGRPVETADVSGSELIRRLIEQRVTLRSQLAEQSSTLLDAHPRIKELKAQIGALDVQIRGELERMGRSLENDARVAAARVDAITGNLDQIKKTATTNGEQDVQLRALEREAKAQRDLLENYLARYREATARENLDVAPVDARVISRATAPHQAAFPKKTPIVLIATLGTMFLIITFIIAGEFLNGGVPSEPVTGAGRVEPSLFSRLHLFRRRKDRAVAEPVVAPPSGAPVHAAATTIGDVARNYQALGEGGRRITVIGAARNVGTTFTAIELARLLAQNAKVVLVDLAFGASNLSVLSTDPGAPGIADLIRGRATFGAIITRDQFSRVQLIATGAVTEADYNLLASPRLAMTLEALVRAYDHVVIDAGSVAQAPVDVIAKLAPRALLVATDFADPVAIAARERLLAAGFADVTLYRGTPQAARHAA
ncbi:MAG: GumC family protein [Pseudorhodoplanes sp.]